MARHPKVTRPTAGPYKIWLDSWELALRAQGISDRTITMYLDALTLVAGWLRHDSPKADDWGRVGRMELRRLFVWLQAGGTPCPHRLNGGREVETCDGYGRGYVNNLARAMQQYFAWYAEEEDVTNPMLGFKVPSAPKAGEKLVPVIEEEHLGALIRDAEAARDFHSRRDAAVLRLFACTGTRLAELVGVALGDINQARRELTITGKARKQRTVKYDNRAALALDRYLRMRARRAGAPAGDTAALWLGHRQGVALTESGMYQLIRRRGLRIGIHLHPHMFRHTFAHRWLDAGGAEGDLVELAGWESPQMLALYGRSARSARARRAYDRVDVMGGM